MTNAKCASNSNASCIITTLQGTGTEIKVELFEMKE